MTCQFGTCGFSMVWWHFIHLGLIGPISPRKGLDPFRLRHAGGGIKLASWITPCSVCTVAPEPEFACSGGPLGFAFALLHCAWTPTCTSLPLTSPSLLVCRPGGGHPSSSWCGSLGAPGTILQPKVSGVSVAGSCRGFHFASKKDALLQCCRSLFAV